jgi:protein-S-isoprenylcysteine O-methyltransferase Ste14
VSAWRQARAIALLPGNVTIVVPALILILGSGPELAWGLDGALAVLVVGAGATLIAGGFCIWLWTVRLFSRIGRGTLAPWDPTSRLVVDGPYLHMRNPMISAIAAVLIGEALLLGSPGLAIWAAAFPLVNFAHFLGVEEPGLEERFGEEYRAYKRAVPRWIPRVAPPPRRGPTVELLWWRECPSWERALQMLRAEIEAAGFEPGAIEVTEIEDEAAAERRSFPGSPTILVNGRDIQPPGPDQPRGLTCRVYRHRDGRVSPLPDPADIREALPSNADREESRV